ncbi:MAG: methyltransferase domain-containing protein [Ginsengibacter sp.]
MSNTFKEEIRKGTRFEFGKNWKNFLTTVSEEEIQQSTDEINEWLGTINLKGKRIIDIGSGSGIHSLSLYKNNPSELVSFDYDHDSVEATTQIWKQSGSPANWILMQGSVLDKEFMINLGLFDVVYSWGVLHHTGKMWDAIENSISLLKPGGVFCFSIYQKGPGYPMALKLKTTYNNSSIMGKKAMACKFIFRIMASRLMRGKNPFTWNKKTTRGMNVYHDLVDWMGGLPYEVASQKEIEEFCEVRNLQLVRVQIMPEGSCSTYLFKKH